MNEIKKNSVIILVIGTLVSQVLAGTSSTTFTYQGQLKQADVPYSGLVDMKIALYDAAEGGLMVAGPILFDGQLRDPAPIELVNGLFTIELDFPVAAFNGDSRYLQIEVRSPHDPTNSAPYTLLDPRQRITSVPYAMHVRGLTVDEQGGLQVTGDIQTSGEMAASAYDSNSPNIIKVQGVECARFDDDCDFGIGTTDPQAKLHIGGTPDVDGIMFPDGTLQTTAATDGGGFWVANGDHISNTNSGSIGIGTTNPISALHVVGDASNNAIRAGGTVLVTKGLDETGTGLSVSRVTSGFPFPASVRTEIDGNKIDAFGGSLGLGDANLILNGTSTGKVGIGTSSPQVTLHVLTGTDATPAGGGVAMFGPFGLNVVIDGNEIMARRNGTTNPLYLNRDGGDVSLIANGGGSVSIGVADVSNIPPGVLLAVDGKILCEEVEVQLSQDWPDYVFDDDYVLMPLDELEKTIRRDKHLPGIPAAAVVKSQGLALGAMQAQLLEKVEELTLYVLQLNRELVGVRTANEELRKQIAAAKVYPMFLERDTGQSEPVRSIHP